MKVEIGTKQFAAAERFISSTECPLAIALKELFPKEIVKVGADNVDVGSKLNLKFTGWSEAGNFGHKAQYFIQAAKDGEETPTFIVDIPGLELVEEVFNVVEEEPCYLV